MIRITVDLISARTGQTTKLGEMHICNAGTAFEDPDLGDYTGRIMRKPAFKSVTKTGQVLGHRRQSQVIWVLVAKMLKNMGYIT